MSTDNDLIYDAVDVGIYITKLRKAKKLSMYQLALNSGVSRSILFYIEKGIREPHMNTVFKIIDGLEMRPAEFFRTFN
ncbi:MAG: helix-turn-helix domain-containing protein [Candidatus Margulisbacteria bacterium]|nr:helix-turn-helix domain-containing protein [Candidatus Margulisiibacteriota bacterium]